MFRPNPSDNYVPSKQIKVYPESQIDYKADGKGTNDIRWMLPSYLSFIDPRNAKVSFDLTMSGRGKPRPKSVAAGHSLFRNVRIQDGDSIKVIEEMLEYNQMIAQKYSYEENENVIKHRELFEGLSKTTAQDAQLYWNADKVDNTFNTSNATAKTVRVELPIHSGLLGEQAPSAVPLAALNGIRMSMIVDKVINCVESGLDKNVYVETVGTGLDFAADTTIAQKTAVGDTQDLVLEYNGSSENAGVLMPVQVGDRLWIEEGSNTTTCLVTGTKYNPAGSGTYTVQVIAEQAITQVDVAYTAAAAKLYLKRGERLNGWTPSNVGAAASAAIAAAGEGVDFTISDLEMKILQIYPSTAYTSAMASKINSGEGLTLNIKANSMIKVNTTGVNGLLSLHIPITQKRSYALNCSPLPVEWQYDEQNLTGLVDGLETFQFYINGRAQPDRPVSTKEYAQANGQLSQQHLFETNKALLNSQVIVRDLQNVKSNFLISRAFSKFGLVSDVTRSDLSLRLEYSGAQKLKAFNCVLCSLTSINISNKGLEVVY